MRERDRQCSKKSTRSHHNVNKTLMSLLNLLWLALRCVLLFQSPICVELYTLNSSYSIGSLLFIISIVDVFEYRHAIVYMTLSYDSEWWYYKYKLGCERKRFFVYEIKIRQDIEFSGQFVELFDTPHRFGQYYENFRTQFSVKTIDKKSIVVCYWIICSFTAQFVDDDLNEI